MIHPEVRFMVSQDGDCCCPGSQELEISTQCGSHDPSDFFYVLKTSRWTFNDPSDLAHLLREIFQRVGSSMHDLVAPLSGDPDLYKED